MCFSSAKNKNNCRTPLKYFYSKRNLVLQPSSTCTGRNNLQALFQPWCERFSSLQSTDKKERRVKATTWMLWFHPTSQENHQLRLMKHKTYMNNQTPSPPGSHAGPRNIRRKEENFYQKQRSNSFGILAHTEFLCLFCTVVELQILMYTVTNKLFVSF